MARILLMVPKEKDKKATCKSRPGHLVSSAWYLWIVHECGIHLQAKMDFNICDHIRSASKIQTLILFENLFIH